MTYEEAEQLEEWVEKWNEIPWNSPDVLKFEKLEDKDKPYESEQVCAIMFLYNKLKADEKEQRCGFFHGEHDIMYIGSSFDIFEPFTEEEAKLMVAYGINFADDGDGFQIYASM